MPPQTIALLWVYWRHVAPCSDFSSFTAVAFLESMGLPKPLLHATRKQVEQGKLDFSTTEEYKLYARHNKPADSE